MVDMAEAADTGSALATRIRQALTFGSDSRTIAATALSVLMAQRLDDLPLPGGGHTLGRWRALAAVAALDLSLAKLYEGHTDALAILAELRVTEPLAPGSWCVWAAEAPQARVHIAPAGVNTVYLSGTKSWCSGAATADHALLTAWDANASVPQLVSVRLRQPGVAVDSSLWRAVGMADSASLQVHFDHATGRRVGDIGAYLKRPGFWQGGAGIAACWWGGALGIGQALKNALHRETSHAPSPFKLAALGKVSLALAETAAVLREAAMWIDAHPLEDASRVALMARLSAEQCAKRVLEEVGNAMGATPFCRDEKFARAAADLPVFIRQSHALQDCQALGERIHDENDAAWTL